MEAINSNRSLDVTAFGRYCAETAELYLSLYPWYYMPVTVHKVLIHGQAIVTILSREAQEASNKLYKNFREFHAMKHVSEATNHEVFQRRLVISDPYLYRSFYVCRENSLIVRKIFGRRSGTAFEGR